jgi:hypothetical protein
MEAARLLGIGRTLAYQEAGRYIDSGGREGIPAIRIGRCVRVPRAPLLVYADTGQLVAPTERDVRPAALPRPVNRPRRLVVRRASRRASAGIAPVRRPEVRPEGRVRRPPVGRRAGPVEQLRLLPGD